jgi:hypothetical protein
VRYTLVQSRRYRLKDRPRSYFIYRDAILGSLIGFPSTRANPADVRNRLARSVLMKTPCVIPKRSFAITLPTVAARAHSAALDSVNFQGTGRYGVSMVPVSTKDVFPAKDAILGGSAAAHPEVELGGRCVPLLRGQNMFLETPLWKEKA